MRQSQHAQLKREHKGYDQGKPSSSSHQIGTPGHQTLILQQQIGNRAAQEFLRNQSRQRQSEDMHLQRQNTLENQSFNIQHDVELIPQLTDMSCWAAGAAMLVAWRDQVSINPSEIANATGYWQQYKDGLEPQDTHMFDTWGLTPEPPQSFMVTAFAQLIQQYGPLWVAQQIDAPHILVVTGISGDGTPTGTILSINDPWPPGGGSQYTLTYAQFESQQASLAASERDLPGTPLYVAHL